MHAIHGVTTQTANMIMIINQIARRHGVSVEYNSDRKEITFNCKDNEQVEALQKDMRDFFVLFD